jgi:hypothetical protein
MTQLTAASAVFTRPNNTTAYSSGQTVADSTTAGSCHPLIFLIPTANFKLQRVGMVKSGSGNTNAQFRLHLYSNAPTLANGDGATWSTTQSAYLGDIDVDMSIRAFTDNAQGFGLFATSDVPAYLALNPSTLTIYGVLEARGAYTPLANEIFTVTLYGETY